MIGTTVGNYHFLASLGRGGTGEVYRARDLRLEREVAVKVLQSEGGTGALQLSREARVLATVRHPNIATIHGLEESDGRALLVMELVRGETLERRLARGPLSVEQSVRFARQIAAALEAAHRCGVVHRDLKPANIQIHGDGEVKVLDFGLARLRPAPILDEGGDGAPTHTDESTFTGRIAGTLPYMSPEQLRAEDTDEQTDVWALGCCLFECLAGRRAFDGETPSDTLANVLRGEPPWSELPAALPPQLERLLRRCLRKDRTERQRSVGDVWLELGEIEGVPETALQAGAARPRASSGARWWVAAAVVTLLILALFWLATGREGREEAGPLGEPAADDEFLTIRVPRDQLESLLQSTAPEPEVIQPTEPRLLEQ